MDITPHVNLLRSLRGGRINHVALLGEGIDNAFDADANTIRIAVTDDLITFRDDGVGITRDRIASVFSLGEHGNMSTTQLGRFGVGIKHQAVNAGNMFGIISRSKDGYVRVEVDWREILSGGRWQIEDPEWLPLANKDVTGTDVIISALRSAPKFNIERAAEQLALNFHPALVEGKHIVLNARVIEVLPEPAMTDVVDRQLSLSGGRSAHLRAGILAGPSKLHKVHIAYKHRVIMPADTLGCGVYGGLIKMFARIQIAGPWHLGTFKDDLVDAEQREELEEAVAIALEPILKKCSSEQMTAKINNLAHELNEMLPPALTPARPRREKSKSENQSEGKSQKSGEVDADKSDVAEGPARAKRPPRNTLFITFDGVYETDGVGAFAPGKPQNRGGAPHRVDLSLGDPTIALLATHRDEPLAKQALYVIAMMIFEQGLERVPDQGELDLVQFGLRVARHLSIQDYRGAVVV